MKPILFNTEMVRAILEGRKTQTRRVIKPRSKNACGFHVTFRKSDNAFMGVYDYDENEMQFDNPQTPPYQVGDILYVRETWAVDEDLPYGNYIYRADDENPIGWCAGYSWRPSIHMPKEAARIFLKVTNVRVERLCAIRLDGYLKEGVQLSFIEKTDLFMQTMRARNRFSVVWDSTIKKSDLDRYGWNANPWVWVYEFERCEKPEVN